MLIILCICWCLSVSTCVTSKQLTWYGFSFNPESSLKYFTIPLRGACSYAAREITVEGKSNHLRHYIIFYQPDSYLMTKISLTCDGESHQTEFTCDVKMANGTFIRKESKRQYVAKLTLNQGAITFYILNKEINMEGNYLLFEEEHHSQIINFFIDMGILVAILVVLTRSNQHLYRINQDSDCLIKRITFLTQFHLIVLLFLFQACCHVKDAMENWSSSYWKLCILAPIIFIIYKVMEAATTRIICCKQTLRIIGIVIFLNFTALNVLQQSYIYFLLISLVSFCQISQQQNILSYQVCFSILLIKLILTKDFLYIGEGTLHFNTLLALIIYFSTLGGLIFVFICVYLRQYRQKQKLMVKVVEKCSFQRSQGCIDSKLEDDCPICYQKLSKNNKPLAYTPCKHIFHSQCLRQWMKQSQTCPIDRTHIMIGPPVSTHSEITKG